MRTLYSLLVLALFIPGRALAGVIAEAKGHTFTNDELLAFARLMQYPYEDPWETALSDPDPDIRVDAREVTAGAFRHLLFDRVWSAKAIEAGRSEPDPQLWAQVAGAVESCVERTWRESLEVQADTLQEADVRAIATRMQDQFRAPETRTVFYIYRTAMDHAERAFLADLRERILSGETTFREAAFRYSEAPSSRHHGYLGVFHRESELPAAFRDLIFATAEDEISTPTLLGNGLYMVHVAGVQPARNPSVEELMEPSWLPALLALENRERMSRATMELPAEEEGAARMTLPRRLIAAGKVPDLCAEIERLGRATALAHEYWRAQHEHQFEPDQAEMEQAYERMKALLIPSGQFRLTRFAVPIGTTREAAIKSREAAQAKAAEIREALAAGGDLAELQRAHAGVLDVRETSEWAMGSGIGDADSELLGMEAGEFTTVHVRTEGAIFFRLDQRQALTPAPLEEVREHVYPNARNSKMWNLRAQEIRRLTQELELRVLWPADPTGP
ncbi:MAG: peptidyl-prolyl cis-trans isomerase [Candidatus Sumerlaeia bacterium]|nr:peptidyl-prolyl cis-trans isomerase [Candidatus Sumerlaeia bacterium]